MGSKWQRAGGKAGGTHVGRQQEKHSSTLGVPTRELVAQALGCELGSLGWSRARYGASQSGRQQGCGQGRGRYLNDSPVGCALRSAGAATSTYGYGTARLLYTVRLRAAVGVRLKEQRQGRGHLTTMGEREERHDAAEMEGGVGWGGLVDSATGALLLKATSTMEGALAVGLTSTRTTTAGLS